MVKIWDIFLGRNKFIKPAFPGFSFPPPPPFFFFFSLDFFFFFFLNEDVRLGMWEASWCGWCGGVTGRRARTRESYLVAARVQAMTRRERDPVAEHGSARPVFLHLRHLTDELRPRQHLSSLHHLLLVLMLCQRVQRRRRGRRAAVVVVAAHASRNLLHWRSGAGACEWRRGGRSCSSSTFASLTPLCHTILHRALTPFVLLKVDKE